MIFPPYAIGLKVWYLPDTDENVQGKSVLAEIVKYDADANHVWINKASDPLLPVPLDTLTEVPPALGRGNAIRIDNDYRFKISEDTLTIYGVYNSRVYRKRAWCIGELRLSDTLRQEVLDWMGPSMVGPRLSPKRLRTLVFGEQVEVGEVANG